jgi:hypothetical protein
MIGSISTYAMWAGMANSNGHVILPDCSLFVRGALPTVPGVTFVPVQAARSGGKNDGGDVLNGMNNEQMLKVLLQPIVASAGDDEAWKHASELARQGLWNGHLGRRLRAQAHALAAAASAAWHRTCLRVGWSC